MVIKHKKAEKKNVALRECIILHSSYTGNLAITHTEPPAVLHMSAVYPC